MARFYCKLLKSERKMEIFTTAAVTSNYKVVAEWMAVCAMYYVTWPLRC